MTYFLKPRNLAFSFSEVFSCEGHKILEKSEIDSLWQEYWGKFGEEIVLETWNRLYGDYVLQEDNNLIENKVIQDKDCELVEIAGLDLGEDTSSSYTEDWEELWTSHWSQQQYYVYSLFKDNYHAEFDPFLVKLTLEEDFIKKLGLPTSFSGKAFLNLLDKDT